MAERTNIALKRYSSYNLIFSLHHSLPFPPPKQIHYFKIVTLKVYFMYIGLPVSNIWFFSVTSEVKVPGVERSWTCLLEAVVTVLTS